MEESEEDVVPQAEEDNEEGTEENDEAKGEVDKN